MSRQEMDSALSIWAGVIIALLILAVAGEGDYQDAVASERHYCEMVEGKAWPAYNPDINCEE
jgi:hypothetical protein